MMTISVSIWDIHWQLATRSTGIRAGSAYWAELSNYIILQNNDDDITPARHREILKVTSEGRTVKVVFGRLGPKAAGWKAV